MPTGPYHRSSTPAAAIRIMAEAAATNPHDLPADLVERGAATIDWARGVESSFGRAVGDGMSTVAGQCGPVAIGHYLDRITEAGTHGPTLGKLMAELLVPVMGHNDGALLDPFLETVAVMRQKGTYTLNHGLGPVGPMLTAGDADATLAYLTMAATLFALPLTYNRSLYLSEAIPRAVLQIPDEKRLPLIAGLSRLISVDPGLIDPYLDGIGRGLTLLDADALANFVDAGLAAYDTSPRKAHRHLALISHSGRDAWNRSRRAVTFSSVQGNLSRYARARLGASVGLRLLTDLPDGIHSPLEASPPLVASDDKTLYLTDQLSLYPSQEENRSLYTCLVRLESGLLECATYAFDFERAKIACNIWKADDPAVPPQGRSDMEWFFLRFPDPHLAWDLFTILEHGRVARRLKAVYPGLARRTAPLIADALSCHDRAERRLARAYCSLLQIAPPPGLGPPTNSERKWLTRLEALAAHILAPGCPVEATAQLLFRMHDELAEALMPKANQGRLHLPFGRRVRPDLAIRSNAALDRLAAAITTRYRDAGIGLFKETVRKALTRAHPDGVATMRFQPDPKHPLTQKGEPPPARDVTIDDLVGSRPTGAAETEPVNGQIFWYPEWDMRLGDQMEAHCRVVVQSASDGPATVYQTMVDRHHRLVGEVRKAFERIRPEGMGLLRQWIDGDDFDYRALVDYAVDRHGGRTPSDRLYIKRIKHHRDVAVLLLVDLSRSTAGPAGTDPDQTVLGVAQSALVLFCEALEVLGDSYALAGFSGHGRLDVRYWPIKSFQEPLTDRVQGRIGALTPHRSTRMGAAIRHAGTELSRIPAAVRLLLIIGDGFPNDIDYKKDYAIEDTQRAIGETRAKGIFTHGITVNVAADPQLDRLYGPVHQSVIMDVTELPERLWRIYRALTT